VKRFYGLLLGVLVVGCGGGGESLFGGEHPSGDNYASRMDLTYWPSRPVRVAFAKTGTYTSEREQVATASFQKWFQPTDGLVDFVVVDPEDNPNILVRFAAQAVEEEPNVAGVTTLRIRDEAIQSVTIDIGTGLSASDFAKTSTHEFGHAYGLTGGHSDLKTDIMYPYLTATTSVSQRDANTMELAYANRRGRVDPESPIVIWRISLGDDGCIHTVVHPDPLGE
jgi:hypothetical protein